MPLLQLEALKAKHGDALILHYGEAARPRTVVIDAGPPGVFKDVLRPRLEQLRAERGDSDGALPVELLMVSHIDDDHIAGVVQMLRELRRAQEDGTPAPWRLRRLWHNSFREIAGVDDPAVVRAAVEEAPKPSSLPVVASIDQGREVDAALAALGIARNGGNGLIVAGQRFELPGGLRLEVLAPAQAEVDALREEFAKHLDADVADVVPAAYLDDSVFNLASIVAVATLDGREILLTGDARGDHILEGLRTGGRLDANGRAHFALLKVPHHGSDRNVTTDFFRRVTADHYVISGDGKHGNPEKATLEMLAEAREAEDYVVHLTYRTGKEGLGDKIDAFLAEQQSAGRAIDLRFPADGASGLAVDLLS